MSLDLSTQHQRSGVMTLDQQIEEVENKIHKMWDGSERRDMRMLSLCRDLLELIKLLKDKVETPDRKATS